MQDIAKIAPSNEKSLGIVLSIITALGFSSLSILGKLGQNAQMPSSSLLFWRFLIAGLILMVFNWRSKVSLRSRILMFGFGIVYFVQTNMYFAALERISAGTSSLLLYLAPAFVVLYQRIFFGKRPKLEQVLAIGLSLVGLIVIIGLPSEQDKDLFGVLIGMATGAAYAGYLVASEKFLSTLPAFTISAHTSLATALGFALLGASNNTLRLPNSSLEWSLVAGMVVFPTLIAVPAMFAAIGKAGATQASILFTLEPAFVVLLAALLLGEPFGLSQLLGGGLILVGAILAQIPGQTRA
jgi:drug/metabolite transporter (DMT)-like permease